MTKPNYDSSFIAELTALRRDLHRVPELSSEETETAKRMAGWLADCEADEVITGLGGTGVAGVFDSGVPGPAILFRCELDALPIHETGIPNWRSKIAGKGHMCGHDGHMTILCGLARRLQAVRPKRGRVILLFQPAEETGGGAEVMVDQGVLDRFDISQVYALHNAPGFEKGGFYTSPGAMMAAVDEFHIHIKGLGGHGATPHLTRDPVVAACGIATALQTIVSRNHYAQDDLVVSVTQIHTGTTDNVIPETAYINGTVRSFDKEVQAMVIRRMEQIVAGQAAS